VSGRHYHRNPAPDAGRDFNPNNNPSTLRSWLGTLAIAAKCSPQPAPVAVQP
jgi:hypothetical protein